MPEGGGGGPGVSNDWCITQSDSPRSCAEELWSRDCIFFKTLQCITDLFTDTAERVPPGHPLIILKCNKFNMAT